MVQVVEFVLGQQLRNHGDLVIRHVRDNDMLVSREPESPLVNLSNFPQPSLEMTIGFVLDTPVLDEDGVVLCAVQALGPAKDIHIGFEGERASWLE